MLAVAAIWVLVLYGSRRVVLGPGAIWVLMLLVNSPILASYGVVREDDFVICDIKATNTTTQRQVRYTQ